MFPESEDFSSEESECIPGVVELLLYSWSDVDVSVLEVDDVLTGKGVQVGSQANPCPGQLPACVRALGSAWPKGKACCSHQQTATKVTSAGCPLLSVPPQTLASAPWLPACNQMWGCDFYFRVTCPRTLGHQQQNSGSTCPDV